MDVNRHCQPKLAKHYKNTVTAEGLRDALCYLKSYQVLHGRRNRGRGLGARSPSLSSKRRPAPPNVCISYCAANNVQTISFSDTDTYIIIIV